MRKAFFFDIDGTILNVFGGLVVPSQKTRTVFEQLKAEGSQLFIVTGRPPYFIFDEILKLPIDGIAASNGAYVSYRNEVIYERSALPEEIGPVIRYCRERGILIGLETDTCGYVENSTEVLRRYVSRARYSHIEVTEDLNQVGNVHKFFICGDDLRQCFEAVSERFPAWFGNPFYDLNYAEFSHRSANKATGIEQLLKQLPPGPVATYAFGDGLNDIEMFRQVDVGVAMGDAHPQLKKEADQVTGTVLEEGIYQAVKQIMEQEKES